MQNEPWIRLSAFFGILAVMALWETWRPRRGRSEARSRRWPGNLSLVMLNTFLSKALLPATGVGMAMFVQSRQWGIFHAMHTPYWLAVAVSVLLLDMVIYLQHVMFHVLPLLWRFHQMHHADMDLDVTSGTRFHPVEILISMLIKYAAIIMLGAPPLGVLLFEVALNGTAMFNHSNVHLPIGLDRVLRWFIVTPDMHRVHHSVERAETDSNFGFNLPWWDRLFGTYIAQPRKGHEHMVIGLPAIRDSRQCHSLPGMLMIPFRGKRSK